MIGTAAFNKNAANALANLVSNLTVHSYSSAVGQLSMWFTSTQPSANPAGSGYPAWTYPDGSGGVYPSAAACGSSPSNPAPGFNWASGVANPCYIGAAYNINSGSFHVVYGPSASLPTDAQIASAVGDGQLVTVLSIASAGNAIPAGGGGGTSSPGGGGHIVNRY